jgi:F0F1-type ATP synthase assembly protein I
MSENVSQWEAVGFVTELLVAIAAPTTLLALAGRWLDRTYQLSPWCTIVGLALSLLISYALIKRKAATMASRLGSKNTSKH